MRHTRLEKIDPHSFKTFAALQTYCTEELGEPTIKGKEIRYHCPFCEPGSPNLVIRENNGIGLWKCWSCDEKGDIYNLAAKLEGKNTKTHFTEILHSISSLTKTLTINHTTRAPYKKPCQQHTHTPSRYLSEQDETLLWQAMHKMQTDRATREQLAKELGLSPITLLIRAQHPELGAVGITPDNRLLYIYVEMDNIGNLKITGCKLRARPNHPNPYLKIEQGKWKSHGTMNPTAANPKGVRFIYPAGKPYAPWGIADLPARNTVILTEGESDALAYSEAYDHLREIYSGATDEHTGLPYEDIAGTLEAQLPAILSIPGVSGYKKEWTRHFIGKKIIIAYDTDEAGQKAALKTRDLLSPVAKTHNLKLPPPYKDAREIIQKKGAAALLAITIQNLIEKHD